MKNMMDFIISIKKISSLTVFCLFFSVAFGQGKPVTGTILSSAGDVLKNVEVSVKENPGIKVLSDDNGVFSIPAEPDQHLVIEYGKKARKVIRVSEIENNKNIVLDRASKLVNVGYGKDQREEEIASSIGSISSEKIENITAHTIGSTLFGQVSGLRVFQNAGIFPDVRTPELNIRGQSTTQDNSILILIDGVERPLNTVIPEEVESISVLRDAAAKAKYGQKGANGVLLVNTKSGSPGKIRFTASFDQGMTQPVRLPEFLNAADYAKAENEARINDGMLPKYTQKEIDYFGSGQYPYLYPNVNWVDETLSEAGKFSRFNFGFSGGDNVVKYFVSMNYQNESGFYENTEENEDFSTQLHFDQLNLRTNLEIKLTPLTTVHVGAAGLVISKYQPATPNAGQSVAQGTMFSVNRYSINRLASEDIVYDAFSIPSALFPVRNFNGTWGGTNLFGNNPLAETGAVGLDMNHIRSFSNEIRLEQDLSKVVEGLSAELFGAYFTQSDYWENKTKTFSYVEVIPQLDESGAIIDTTLNYLGKDSDLNPVRYSGNGQITNYDLRGGLNYNNNFGAHNINSWILYQVEQIDLHQENRVYRYSNLAGNILYSYADKYFLDATISYSGTNRIQVKSDRYGLFPAIAGAWLISKESFLEDVDFLTLLKLRASYGKVGNGNIPIADLTSSKFGGGSSFAFGATHASAGGLQESELGIASKIFESSIESNVAIEARLSDKLDLTAELFNARRKDIFVAAVGRYSTILGLLPQQVPEGEVVNRGYELEGTWNDKSGDFTYFISGMFSRYQNEIINMNEEYRPYDYMKRTGKPIGQYFGLESAGFFSSESEITTSPVQSFGDVQPGDIKYVDQNADDNIDEFDIKAIGNSNFPEIYYSASLGVGYKGFQISGLFQGTGKSSAYLSSAHVFWPLVGNNNISTWYVNYWSPGNQSGAELPRLAKMSDNNYRSNDIWIRDNSYLKLRYAEISYSFPQNFLANFIKLQQAKIYLRGTNLFSLDDIEYVDPENTGATYPVLRTFNAGIQIKF